MINLFGISAVLAVLGAIGYFLGPIVAISVCLFFAFWAAVFFGWYANKAAQKLSLVDHNVTILYSILEGYNKNLLSAIEIFGLTEVNELKTLRDHTQSIQVLCEKIHNELDLEEDFLIEALAEFSEEETAEDEESEDAVEVTND